MGGGKEWGGEVGKKRIIVFFSRGRANCLKRELGDLRMGLIVEKDLGFCSDGMGKMEEGRGELGWGWEGGDDGDVGGGECGGGSWGFKGEKELGKWFEF